MLMLMLMVTVALTQLWCDFDKSSSLRNQTFNESSPVPDICFYPEVGQSCSRVHLSHVPPSASAQTQRGGVQSWSRLPGVQLANLRRFHLNWTVSFF